MITEGLLCRSIVFRFTLRSKGDGSYEICNDFILDDWLRAKIKKSEEELVQEKGCVGHLIGLSGASCAIRGTEDTTVSRIRMALQIRLYLARRKAPVSNFP
jgi:hypothetical protein